MKKRKILFLLLSIIAIVGCSKKEVEEPSDNTYSFKYNDDYYTIYMPYKKGVGNNYVVSSNVVDYDINKVEKDLIQISSNVFRLMKIIIKRANIYLKHVYGHFLIGII